MFFLSNSDHLICFAHSSDLFHSLARKLRRCRHHGVGRRRGRRAPEPTARLHHWRDGICIVGREGESRGKFALWSFDRGKGNNVGNIHHSSHLNIHQINRWHCKTLCDGGSPLGSPQSPLMEKPLKHAMSTLTFLPSFSSPPSTGDQAMRLRYTRRTLGIDVNRLLVLALLCWHACVIGIFQNEPGVLSETLFIILH